MSDKLLEVKNLSVEYDTEISTVYAVPVRPPQP